MISNSEKWQYCTIVLTSGQLKITEKKNARCRYCALYSKMCSHSSYKLQYVIKLKHYNLGKIKLPEYKAHALIIMVFESFRYWVQSPNFNVRKFEHSLIIWPTLTI